MIVTIPVRRHRSPRRATGGFRQRSAGIDGRIQTRCRLAGPGRTVDYQKLIFGWIAHQHWTVGVVVMAAGLLYGFQGFRVFKFVLGLSCAIIGLVGGYAAAIQFDLPPLFVSPALGAAAAAFSFSQQRPAVVVVSGVTWGVLGHYLSLQVGLPGIVPLIAAAVSGGFGGLFAHLCFRPMTVVMTSLHGIALIVIGFVGMSNRLLPSVGETFVVWAHSWTLLVPMLMTMLFVMSYSYQSSAQRGDIISRV